MNDECKKQKKKAMEGPVRAGFSHWWNGPHHCDTEISLQAGFAKKHRPSGTQCCCRVNSLIFSVHSAVCLVNEK